jgi:hypothetical protein
MRSSAAYPSLLLPLCTQKEAVFLRQKGAVLELLLEVASEVAVHKRQHTGTKFPELKDTQLLEFLEQFLESYGGYAAERPTIHNYFNLQRCVLPTAHARAGSSLSDAFCLTAC